MLLWSLQFHRYVLAGTGPDAKSLQSLGPICAYQVAHCFLGQGRWVDWMLLLAHLLGVFCSCKLANDQLVALVSRILAPSRYTLLIL